MVGHNQEIQARPDWNMYWEVCMAVACKAIVHEKMRSQAGVVLPVRGACQEARKSGPSHLLCWLSIVQSQCLC